MDKKKMVALSDDSLDKVSGGTVYISRDFMMVAFDTTGEQFHLKNCTFRDANDLSQDLWEANQTLGDAEFDALVKSELLARGWI